MASRKQLHAAGLGRGAIDHRLKVGLLHRQFPDVFLIGPGESPPLAVETAAVLHFDGHAVLTHGSGAAAWGYVPEWPPVPELTLVGPKHPHLPGAVVHRSTTLTPADVRLRNGLPVTSPTRTLVDCAGVLAEDELAQALSIALDRGLTSPRELEHALRRWPGARGIGRLRALLARDGTAITRSYAERRLRALLRAAELPQPQSNVRWNRFELDFVWEEQRLVLEVDSFQWHGDRATFESDRRRDQILTAAGYRVIRVTARQLRDDPLAVIARIAQALAMR